MIGGSIAARSHTAIGRRTKESPKLNQYVHGNGEWNRPKTALPLRSHPPPGYTGTPSYPVGWNLGCS